MKRYAVDADVIHLVPTLHVLFSRNIPASIAKRNYPSSSIHEQEKVRNELITWIADEALAGDKEAAEWVLLSGISNVYAKQHRNIRVKTHHSFQAIPNNPDSTSFHHIGQFPVPHRKIVDSNPFTCFTVDFPSCCFHSVVLGVSQQQHIHSQI